jgi:hypothetical protein
MHSVRLNTITINYGRELLNRYARFGEKNPGFISAVSGGDNS